MAGARAYDLMYRARLARLFWSRVARPEIRQLVEGGACDPIRMAPPSGGPPRAIDLGCGEGAVSVYLAEHGFQTVGVDFSGAALRLARQAARRAGIDDGRLRFVQADLAAPSIPGVEGPFDLLVDYGTLDDLGADERRRAAALIGLDPAGVPGSRAELAAYFERACLDVEATRQQIEQSVERELADVRALREGAERVGHAVDPLAGAREETERHHARAQAKQEERRHPIPRAGSE